MYTITYCAHIYTNYTNNYGGINEFAALRREELAKTLIAQREMFTT